MLTASLNIGDSPDDADPLTDRNLPLITTLERDARITWLARENDEETWEETMVTDLGRLALRVCPVEES